VRAVSVRGLCLALALVAVSAASGGCGSSHPAAAWTTSTPSTTSAATTTTNFGVIGSSLNDTITAAGTGGGTIKAGAGNDTIFSRNGFKDTVDGEAGADSAQVDPTDIVANIETLLA
jgi:Ca2+-binding RTX toxin-like protein